MINIKQLILNWCVKQTANNLRSLDARQICHLKYKLAEFNCKVKKWDVKRAKV